MDIQNLTALLAEASPRPWGRGHLPQAITHAEGGMPILIAVDWLSIEERRANIHLAALSANYVERLVGALMAVMQLKPQWHEGTRLIVYSDADMAIAEKAYTLLEELEKAAGA